MSVLSELAEITDAEGNLLQNSPWIAFNVGDNGVTLDGYFGPDELRAIADHMEKGGKP